MPSPIFHNLSYLKTHFYKNFETYLNFYLKNLKGEKVILQAINYTLSTGGKRLRPFLLYLIGKNFSISQDVLFNIGIALEFFHTYSLIHDDLPALDNDSIRRGKPSCHIAFDESTAILTGDSLLTLGFSLLSSTDLSINDKAKLNIIQETTRALGLNGMISGQQQDLNIAKTTKEITFNDIIHIHTLKTAEFIALPFTITGIITELNPQKLAIITQCGINLGIMFQILDDLLDYSNKSTDLNILNFISCKDLKNYLIILYNQFTTDESLSFIMFADLKLLIKNIYHQSLELLDKYNV